MWIERLSAYVKLNTMDDLDPEDKAFIELKATVRGTASLALLTKYRAYSWSSQIALLNTLNAGLVDSVLIDVEQRRKALWAFGHAMDSYFLMSIATRTPGVDKVVIAQGLRFSGEPRNGENFQLVMAAGDQYGASTHVLYRSAIREEGELHKYVKLTPLPLPRAEHIRREYASLVGDVKLLFLVPNSSPYVGEEEGTPPLPPLQPGEILGAGVPVMVSSIVVLPGKIAALFMDKIWSPEDFMYRAYQVGNALLDDEADFSDDVQRSFKIVTRFARAANLQTVRNYMHAGISTPWDLVPQDDPLHVEFLEKVFPLVYSQEKATNPGTTDTENEKTTEIVKTMMEFAKTMNNNGAGGSPDTTTKLTRSFTVAQLATIAFNCGVANDAALLDHSNCAFFKRMLPTLNWKLAERLQFFRDNLETTELVAEMMMPYISVSSELASTLSSLDYGVGDRSYANRGRGLSPFAMPAGSTAIQDREQKDYMTTLGEAERNLTLADLLADKKKQASGGKLPLNGWEFAQWVVNLYHLERTLHSEHSVFAQNLREFFGVALVAANDREHGYGPEQWHKAVWMLFLAAREWFSPRHNMSQIHELANLIRYRMPLEQVHWPPEVLYIQVIGMAPGTRPGQGSTISFGSNPPGNPPAGSTTTSTNSALRTPRYSRLPSTEAQTRMSTLLTACGSRSIARCFARATHAGGTRVIADLFPSGAARNACVNHVLFNNCGQGAGCVRDHTITPTAAEVATAYEVFSEVTTRALTIPPGRRQRDPVSR